MRLIQLGALCILLTACGSAPSNSTAATKPPVGPPVKATCELIESDLRITLYKATDDEKTVTADAYNCSKANELYVEWRYAASWTYAVYKYSYLETWTKGRALPEFLDPNINCEIQNCRKD